MKVYRDITDNNGVVTSTIDIFDIMEGTYSGTDMGERSIQVTIEYETPIDFKVGDYVEFNIADLVRQSNVEGGNIYERFYLYTMPTIEKTSSPFSARDAFKHTLTFYPRQYELGCTQMRDLIQDNGNNVLYTGWDEFSFYGGAKMLMDRIITVLHERFGTKGVAGIDYWDYKIADEVNEEKNTALEKFQFDFSANSVMDALLKLNEEEGINTKFFINSRMIYVGYKRPYIVGVDDNNIIKTIPFNFQYGKTSHLPFSVNNGGLYSITKSTGQATPITRLYAYGSDKNLHRFYCSDRIKSGRYVNRLMLPSFGDDGVTDYIESEEGIAKFGVREGSKTFDEIYPSLRYFTYGDLREIKYVIKLMGCGIESDDDNVYDAAQEHKYPIARVQCYKVVEGSNGVNTLVKSAPPVDLAVFLHATGKVVKCTLYSDKDGKSSIQRQIAADGTWSNGNGRIPANSLQGSDYIVGSCFAIHDSGYADNNTTITSRNDWFRNTDNITGSNGDGELTEEEKKLVNEIEIHQINYTDTSWITDIYEFEEYEQTHFSRHGYSAYCYPRINKNYPNSQSDSIDVNEVVEVGSVLIEDTELNISEGKNQATYEIYLKDIGFKINEQNWFGEYVFLIDTVKVNFLDGNLGGYSFDVLKETDASELAENIVPAHLPNGEKNTAFFDNAQDTVQATRAYEKGAFWRIVLKRCDTEINNYWLPNTMLNANAGDRIVLLDIYMPDIYQRAAENRLLREATKYLDANDDGDIQYTFNFDKIRLQQIPALARQLREGAIMRIVDNDLQIKTENKTKTIRNNDVPVVYTKSLTYSDVNSAVVEENTYVANRDVEYLKGKGIEQVEITAHIDVHHEGDRGWQGEVVWTFKSGEFNLVISDEDTKNTLQMIGDNKIKVTLYSESKNAYFERVCTIKENIDSKTYKLVLSEDAFEKSEYTGLGSVYVMYSVLINDSGIVTDVTKKILPYGTNVFCEAVDLIDFQAGKYYEVTIDVEDNGLASVDSGSKKTLFALVNGLGDGQRWFIPNYTFERVDETKQLFMGFATYDRYTFKFTLGEDFSDNSSYYPAIRYISDGKTEKVSVRLVSIIERDSDSLIDMNYVDLGIETISINFHDNTRVTPAIPMSYEITATVKEETRASAWVQVMQRIDSTEIVGEQNIRTQETIANMARRHYRELLALKGSIFDPDGTCDQTFLQVMMMQVGADSMNYQLDNTRTGLNKDGLQTLFNCLCANNKFEVGASDRLRHYVYTQGSQGGTWEIAGGVSFALDGKNTYFVAIKCERDGRNGVWVCDTNQHKVDEEENYWYFNWAIINLVGGEYVLTETRGNAYMYGDNLVCGKISTLAGQSYFDLTHGNFVLSDGIKPSLSYIDGVLTISGVNSDDADSILTRLGITEGVATDAKATADGLKWSVIKNYGDADVAYVSNMSVKSLTHKIYEVLPAGTYRATLVSENPGVVNSSVGFSSSSLMIVKSGQSTDTASNILTIVNWGDEFTITENVDIHVMLCQKDYYSSTKKFPYSGTWNLKGIRVLTLTTQSVSALDYIRAALTDGSTEIAGGLTMTNVLMLKNLQGAVTAGMSGLTKLPSDSSKSENVLMWGGGTYEDAYNAAESSDYYKKGTTTPITTLLKKDGTGKIGIFYIDSDTVKIKTADHTTVITNKNIINSGVSLQSTYSFYVSDSKSIDGQVSKHVTYTELAKKSITVSNGKHNIIIPKIIVSASVIATSYTEASVETSGDKDPGYASAYVSGELKLVISNNGSVIYESSSKSISNLEVTNDVGGTTQTNDAEITFAAINKIVQLTEGSLTISLTGSISLGITANKETPSDWGSEASAYIGIEQSETTIIRGIDKYTVIAKDGIAIIANSDSSFYVKNDSSSQLKIIAKGLPTSGSVLQTGQLYRNGSYLCIKQ